MRKQNDNAKVCQSYAFLILPRAKDHSSTVQKRAEMKIPSDAKLPSVCWKNVFPFQMYCTGIKEADTPTIEIEISYFGRDRIADSALN